MGVLNSKGEQDRRAFLAILLAMGVLLLWNVLFPPAVPPPAEDPAAGGDVAQVEGAGDAPGDDPSAATIPPLESDPLTGGTGDGLEVTGPGGTTPFTPTEIVDREQLTIATETMDLVFDNRGARVVSVALPAFEDGAGGPVELLPDEGVGALGSVLKLAGRSVPLDGYVFKVVSDTRRGEDRVLTFELPIEGMVLRKTFTIPPAGYTLQVDQEISGARLDLEGWGLSWSGGLRLTEELQSSSRGPHFQGFVHAEGEVQRKDSGKVRKGPLDFAGATRFVGVMNKYFMAAIVPRGDQQGPSRLWETPSGDAKHPSVGGEIVAPRTPGLSADAVSYDVYVGPQDFAALQEHGLGLEKAIDLGMSWIRPLSRTILSFIIWLHGFVPNYGFVIIIFALVMNTLFLPLTWKSTKSMRDMSALKPRLDALREKYKDEPQKMSEATMKLYKEAGVNPLSGCLPLLIQMPVFFALYAVLFRTIELRQEPFVAWIRDLSQPDVIFNLPFALPFIGSGICLLPIIMGITSYFQSKQTMVDPNQKAMIIMMPIMMTLIFFTLPSGLVLYWLVSNLFTISTKFFMGSPAPAAAGSAEVVESTPVKPKGKSKKRAKSAAK